MTRKRFGGNGPVPIPAWQRKSGRGPVRYVIDVDEQSYLLLMRLVLKYASGTGEGDETDLPSSIDMRVDLANAKRYVRTPEDPTEGVVNSAQ